MLKWLRRLSNLSTAGLEQTTDPVNPFQKRGTAHPTNCAWFVRALGGLLLKSIISECPRLMARPLILRVMVLSPLGGKLSHLWLRLLSLATPREHGAIERAP